MAGLVKQFLQPVAIIWVVLIAVCVWQLIKKEYRWALINGGLVLFMFLLGSTPLSGWLIGTLEKPYLDTLLDSNATADAVVVLGGYTSGGNEELTGIDASSQFDRILTGIELIREGRADRLYVGGGMYRSDDGRKSEHSVIEPWVKRWDLTDVPVVSLGDSGNTYGESKAVKKLMDENGWDNIFLVTSACHMQRAHAVFESSGVKVVPVACDFRSVPGGNTIRFFPGIGGFLTLQHYLYEKVGWLYCRAKGWIRMEALSQR
jgi:uncharacterized SAM-binding protein YcdF (DUF218 family)